MLSLRTFHGNRVAKGVGVLLLGGAAALVIRLAGRLLDGRGLEPYRTGWGIETTPVQALIGIAFSTLVLGIAELVAWLRGGRGISGARRRRARGPMRPRPRESGLPFFAVVIGSGLLAGSCATKQVAVPQAAVPRAAAGTELRLESITPHEGAAIGKGTLLRAKLSYAIADFGPGTYRVVTQFETSDPEVTAGDDTGACTLVTASGRCDIEFPMDVVWSSKFIKRPFVVWFYLTKGTEPGASTLMARAGPVRFRAH